MMCISDFVPEHEQPEGFPESSFFEDFVWALYWALWLDIDCNQLPI